MIEVLRQLPVALNKMDVRVMGGLKTLAYLSFKITPQKFSPDVIIPVISYSHDLQYRFGIGDLHGCTEDQSSGFL